MERLKGYTTLPFHSTLRVLHLQVESAFDKKLDAVIAAYKLWEDTSDDAQYI